MIGHEINRRFYHLGICFLPILILIWIFVLWQGEHLFDVFPACMIYERYGIFCPGCGTTRAVYHAMHFRFWESIKNSAYIVYALIVYVGYMIYYSVMERCRPNRTQEVPILPFVFVGIGILFIQCILKNL